MIKSLMDNKMNNKSKSQCNISGLEIQKRFFVGLLGLFSTLVLIVLIIMYKLPTYIIFPFIFISALGFLQARSRYCVYFGIKELIKKPEKNKDEIIHIITIILYSLLISLLFSLIFTQIVDMF